jgi:hypothetical protein
VAVGDPTDSRSDKLAQHLLIDPANGSAMAQLTRLSTRFFSAFPPFSSTAVRVIPRRHEQIGTVVDRAIRAADRLRRIASAAVPPTSAPRR